MSDDLKRASDETGQPPAPLCPNLIVHRSNPRLPDDLAAVLRAGAELAITSVGSPEPVMGPLKDLGCLVFADVASVRHAEKAIAAGVDGLVLLTAGAGGQTGWVNPFAFVRAVRFLDGIVVMAGGMADGHACRGRGAGFRSRLHGHQVHRHPREPGQGRLQGPAGQEPARRRAADPRLHRPRTNMLRPSIAAAGLDPDNLPVRGAIDVAKDINASERDKPDAKRWKDIWSAGHSVRAWPTCRRSPSWSSGPKPSTGRRVRAFEGRRGGGPRRRGAWRRRRTPDAEAREHQPGREHFQQRADQDRALTLPRLRRAP